MARGRWVKPELWSDDRVTLCTYPARLLFIASLNFADDCGGLDRSAKQLKRQAFPEDEIEVEPLIQELLQCGLLIEYAVDGKPYLHVRNFLKHQKIQHKSLPRVPPYLKGMIPVSSYNGSGIGSVSPQYQTSSESLSSFSSVKKENPKKPDDLKIVSPERKAIEEEFSKLGGRLPNEATG